MTLRKRVVSVEKGGRDDYEVGDPSLFMVIQRDYRDGEKENVKSCYASPFYDSALDYAVRHYRYLKGIADDTLFHITEGYKEVVEWNGEELGRAIAHESGHPTRIP